MALALLAERRLRLGAEMRANEMEQSLFETRLAATYDLTPADHINVNNGAITRAPRVGGDAGP